MPKSNPTLCGSIAGKIGGLGVLMHNAAYKHLGINFTYVSFEPENAQGSIQAMRSLGIRGFGVTMPFKEEVIKYLDNLDESAEKIGAVNTIVNDDGVLTGYNTDYYGAMSALKEITDIDGKKCVVMGAGGASKAVIFGLLKHTKDITVVARNEKAVKDIAQKFEINYSKDFNAVKNMDYDILINATSVGFNSEESVLQKEDILHNKAVLDVVFSPHITTFTEYAKEKGCKVAYGTRMILHQAVGQFELYTKEKAPIEIMEEAMKKKLGL